MMSNKPLPEIHKGKAFILVSLYFLLTTIPHEIVGQWTFQIFGNLSLKTYNMVVLMMVGLLVLILSVLLARRITAHPDRNQIIKYSILSMLLSSIIVKYLFVLNIEMIHFVQYAIFAILAYTLVPNYTFLLILVIIAGMLDEGFQYFYLSPLRTDYFDFNDVVANTVGGTFGLLVLKVLQQRSMPIHSPIYYHPVLILCVVFALTVVLMFLSGFLAVHPTPYAHWVLIREPKNGFWSVIHPGVTYHVLNPWEWLLITISIVWTYSKFSPSHENVVS